MSRAIAENVPPAASAPPVDSPAVNAPVARSSFFSPNIFFPHSSIVYFLKSGSPATGFSQ